MLIKLDVIQFLFEITIYLKLQYDVLNADEFGNTVMGEDCRNGRGVTYIYDT